MTASGAAETEGRNSPAKRAPRSGVLAARFTALTLLMAVSASTALSPRLSESGVSVYFLPIAILGYAFYRARFARSAAVAAAAFAASVLSRFVLFGGDMLAILPFIAVDIVEAGAVALLARRIMAGRFGPRTPLRVFSHVAAIFAATMLTAAMAATLATGIGEATGFSGSWRRFWRDWLLGDAAAYLSLGAVLVFIGRRRWTTLREQFRGRLCELAAATAFMLVAVPFDLLVLNGAATPLRGLPHPAMVFLTLPAVIWLSARFGRIGAAISILLTAFPAIQLVSFGWGPVWLTDLDNRVLALQIYVIAIAIASYVVAALSEQSDRRRRMTEAALRLAARRAADRADFLTAIGHELRTPMNGVLGLAHLLRMESAGPLPAPYRDYAAHIEASAQRLNVLIADVYDVSGARAPAEPAQSAALPLRALFTQVVEALRGYADRHDATLRADAPEALDIDANEAGLRAALTHLTTNAIRHSPPGGAVALSARALGAQVEIAVTDEGEGFPKDFAFGAERWRRGDSAAGLGLHMVDIVAGMHDGRLDIGRAPGGGACVRLVLPRRRPG